MQINIFGYILWKALNFFYLYGDNLYIYIYENILTILT